MFHIFF
jgi:26S proteasome regulatory subunit T6